MVDHFLEVTSSALHFMKLLWNRLWSTLQRMFTYRICNSFQGTVPSDIVPEIQLITLHNLASIVFGDIYYSPLPRGSFLYLFCSIILSFDSSRCIFFHLHFRKTLYNNGAGVGQRKWDTLRIDEYTSLLRGILVTPQTRFQTVAVGLDDI